MKIAVCIKQVPASMEVDMDPEKGLLLRGNADKRLNPYDSFALEAAIQLKEQSGGEVTILTMGPESALDVLRHGLSFGADKAFLLADKRFAGSDVLATSKALRDAILKAGDFDLVIFGRQTTDGDTGQVGAETAAMLGITFVSNVKKLTVPSENKEKFVEFERDMTGVFQHGKAYFPCAISVNQDYYRTRIPSLRQKMAAKKMPIVTFTADDVCEGGNPEDRYKQNVCDGCNPAERYGQNGSATVVKRIFPVSGDREAKNLAVSSDEMQKYLLGQCENISGTGKAQKSPDYKEQGISVKTKAAEALPQAADVSKSMEAGDYSGKLSVLTLVQLDKNGILDVSKELLSEGRLLAQNTGKFGAVLLGSGSPEVKNEIFSYGVDCLFEMDKCKYLPFTEEVFAPFLLSAIEASRPDIVLVGTSPEGKALASYCAAKLNTGLTADCTGLSVTKEGKLLQTRPAYGGKVMADIITKNRFPQMVTVRQGMVSMADTAMKTDSDQPAKDEKQQDADNKFDTYRIKINEPDKLVVTDEHEIMSSSPLDNAEIILAIGNGVKSRDDIAYFETLAGQLHAELASSRALVEKGWMPSERQIGLSGKSAASKLLICFGISGSVQFLSGVKNVKKIIAVNQDEDAPIFKSCDEFFVGDIYDFVQK